MADLADYRSACEGAAFFDRAHHGKIELVGNEALFFLHNLCTNDIKILPVGVGCEAFLANAKARALAHLFVYRLPGDKPQVLWLDVGPDMGEAVLKHLDRHLISEQVELADRTREYGQFHLCGPQARAVLKSVVGAPVDLGELRHEQRSIDGVGVVQVRRHDLLNLPGYDLVFPVGGAAALSRALQEAGAMPGSAETFEILRVEAGVPLQGVDMDDNRFVVEVGRTAQAISYSKGCYLGQGPIVMARDRGHVNRTFLGLTLADGSPPARGARVFRGGEEVGQVTSAVFSPRLGKAVALAYLRRGSWEPGTAVEVESDGARLPAAVTPLPFAAGAR
jgi:folate-binding protein YgfZ